MPWGTMLYISAQCMVAVGLYLPFYICPPCSVSSSYFSSATYSHHVSKLPCTLYGLGALANMGPILDDVMDLLFDIEFFECDPLTRIEQDAPLHLAVRYANEKDIHLGLAMIKMMCEAGCDPRVKNKRGLKAVDLAIPQYNEVKLVLQKAEYLLVEGVEPEAEDDDDGHNSASDSE